jgi:CRP-like cAMP-binding protein
MTISTGSGIPENHILASLPTCDYQHLVPYLEKVALPFEQILYEAGEPIEYVYFPERGIVSIVCIMEDGATVEISVVGNEGMVGMPVVWGGNLTTTCALVQVPGFAMRMKARLFKAEADRIDPLQKLLQHYTQALHTQISQAVACNRLHTIEARLARWLLSAHDRMHSDEFLLTQEFISQMLGTRRAGVTQAAGVLSKAGIIKYSRGKITIVNRRALEAASCECYEVVSGEFGRLLGAKTTSSRR